MSKMRRLVTAEAERQQELLEAQVWWEEHGSELPPEEFGRGAERPQERVVMPDGSLRARIVSLGALPRDYEDYETLTHNDLSQFIAIASERTTEPDRLDVARAVLNARVEHVLTFIPQTQVELLMDATNGIPWQQLRNGEESKQAVFQRIDRAKNAFLRAWIEHAEDPEVTITEENF